MTNQHDPVNPSRRDFLTKTAATAGALSIGGDLIFGQQDRPIPKAGPKEPLGADETIRMGFIGLGGMGSGHLRATLHQIQRKKANVQIVALSDVAQPRLEDAQKVASKLQNMQVDTYLKYKDLLARDDLHCVLIASPEHWHAQMAVDAIAAGKDVYLEKPMTLRLDQAMWLRQVMDRNRQMRLQVGTQYMMREKYSIARKLIEEGKIGHPTFSQTSYCRNSKKGEWLYPIDKRIIPGKTINWDDWLGVPGALRLVAELYHRWRRYKDFSTGIIGDLLVHMMTPMLFALDVGWPIRVTASGGHYIDKKMENHDQVNLTIEFEKEHTMVVAGSTCNENGLEPMIRGHKGNIFLSSNNCVVRPERVFSDDLDPQEINCKRIAEQNELRLNWLHCVRTREQNVSQVEHASKIMVIVDLATRSMWNGPAYRFDPKTMKVHSA